MKTGQTIRGAAHLAFDAVDQVTTIVEGMYRNIAAAPLPFSAEPEGRAPGIAGLVHEIIRQVNGVTRDVSDLALAPLSRHLDEFAEPGPQREAAIALLNGVCGDHLERSENPLAIPLGFRMVTADGTWRDATSVLRERGVPTMPRIVVFLHGLCMNDTHFEWKGWNHAGRLERELGYTPVYLRYNSGRHISTNGRDFDLAMEELIASWPIPVESVSLVGYSMGGLVARAAQKVAEKADRRWLSLTERAVYLASPHQGAALERGGSWLQAVAGFSPYTAPLTALGRMRSDGITDLRFGNVLDEDWRDYDPHQSRADHRRPAPLTPGVDHYAIAATLSPAGSSFRSDGLVHPDSALGRHAESERSLSFAPDKTRLFHECGHLSALEDDRVADCLVEFLA